MDEYFDKLHDEVVELERWLATHRAPEAAPGLREKLQSAVRRELAAAEQAKTSVSSGPARRFRGWHGAVAAAAVLAISVGAGWLSMSIKPATSPTETVPHVANNLAVASEIPVYHEFEQDVAKLESWSDEIEPVDVSSIYDAFNQALSDESGAAGSTSFRGNDTSVKAKVAA